MFILFDIRHTPYIILGILCIIGFTVLNQLSTIFPTIFSTIYLMLFSMLF
jgi:hypothetical protein